MFWSTRKPPELDSRFDQVWVHPTAEIEEDVRIGPFSTIGPHCKIGAGCHLHNNVTLAQNVEIGKDNEIYPNTVIGGLPQDKKYAGEDTRVIMGDGNIIRENVTINSGTLIGDGLTKLGNNNLIMANCHIAHDSILEDEITMANNVLLGGHVKVESFANFGGLAAVHHFVTVGQHSFVGGMTRITQDVPPFMLMEGNPSRVWAVNRVGLRRRGATTEILNALKIAHRLLFRSGKTRSETLEDLIQTFPNIQEVHILCKFLRATELSNQGRARQPLSHEGWYSGSKDSGDPGDHGDH